MWIDLEGLANLRDVGGLPTTDGGKIIPGRLLRSDNLQTLTPSDIDQLLGLGLTDVVDLRSDYERELEGPGPLARTGVRRHELSLFREWRAGVGEEKPDVRPEVLPEEALPWVDLEPQVDLDNAVASVYFSYLIDRPDSIARGPAGGRVRAGRRAGALRGRQGPDRHGGRPGPDRGWGGAGGGGGGLRGQLGAGRAGRGPADGLDHLRREPPRAPHLLAPEPARVHHRLPEPHRPRVRRGRCASGQDGLD